MKDSSIKAIVAGTVGGLFYQLFVWMFWLLGYAKITPFQVGAYVLVQPGIDITSIAAQGLGAVQHFSHSIFLALIALYFLRKTGYDYLLVKGMAFGGIIYFFLYGVFARFLIPMALYQPDIATSVVFMFGNLIFGLTVFYAIGKISKLDT